MAKQEQIPGMMKSKPDVGDPKIRLKAEVSVTVTDTWTGEKCKNVVPLETDDPGTVMDVLDKALCHQKTKDLITIFVDGRHGASGSDASGEPKATRVRRVKKEADPLAPSNGEAVEAGAEAH